jgi:uncharacterized protein (DUF4415 family)
MREQKNKKPISIRIPIDTLELYRKYAQLSGLSYQGRINAALARDLPRLRREIKELSETLKTE